MASIAEAAVSSQAAARAHSAARRTATRLSGGRCSDGAVQDEVPAIIHDCVVTVGHELNGSEMHCTSPTLPRGSRDARERASRRNMMVKSGLCFMEVGT